MSRKAWTDDDVLQHIDIADQWITAMRRLTEVMRGERGPVAFTSPESLRVLSQQLADGAQKMGRLSLALRHRALEIEVDGRANAIERGDHLRGRG
jgi:hypothetical protein